MDEDDINPHRQVRHQQRGVVGNADLLIQRFLSLEKKCETYIDTERGGPIDIIGQHHLKEYHWLRLQSSLLPHLQQQIDSLSDSLHLSKLSEELDPQMELILVKQSQMRNALDQVLSAFDSICPQPLYIYRVNDQYLKELKIYRINRLHDCFRHALRRIAFFSRTSSELIRQVKLLHKQYNGRSRTHVAHTSATLVHAASLVSNSVQTILKWLHGSEFDLVQDATPASGANYFKPEIDMRLTELMTLINATARCEEDGDYFAWDEFTIEPLSKSVIEVAKLLAPIFKLCRLFFKHLSAPGIDRKSLPLYTHMSSQQLITITELPSAVHGHLDDIMDNLRCSQLVGIADEVIKLETSFDAPCNLILLHFVPILPNTDCSPVRDEFRDWLTTWNTQFTLAINNVVRRIV